MSKKDFNLFEYMAYMNATDKAGRKGYVPCDGIDTIWSLFVLGVLVAGVVTLLLFGIPSGVTFIGDAYHYRVAQELAEEGKYVEALQETFKIESDYLDSYELAQYCRARDAYEVGYAAGAWNAIEELEFTHLSDELKDDLDELKKELRAKKKSYW